MAHCDGCETGQCLTPTPKLLLESRKQQVLFPEPGQICRIKATRKVVTEMNMSGLPRASISDTRCIHGHNKSHQAALLCKTLCEVQQTPHFSVSQTTHSWKVNSSKGLRMSHGPRLLLVLRRAGRHSLGCQSRACLPIQGYRGATP